MSNIRTTPELNVSLTGPGKNVLTFEQKSDNKYIPMSIDGFPVSIRVCGNTLLIEQRYNCTYDEEKLAYIGGEIKTLLEINLK